MFRRSYTNLTAEQTAAKIAAKFNASPPASAAPDGTRERSTALSNTTLSVVTDKVKLTYKFNNHAEQTQGFGGGFGGGGGGFGGGGGGFRRGTRPSAFEATVTIDGGAPFTVKYGALEARDCVLFAHLVPNTQTAYAVIWDRKTNLATVFEMWTACDQMEQPREVAREVYYGYVEKDGAAPEARHHLTNRLENKAIVWDDGEKKLLEIFNATMYCSLVELDEPDSGIPIAMPADYIKINDETYIFARVELEFSGMIVLRLIDLFTVKAATLKFGFDAKDEFVWNINCDKGEIVGQLATFGKFTDYGGGMDFNAVGGPPGGEAPVERPKGKRAVYRVHGHYPDFTEEQARNAGTKPNSFPKAGQMMMPTGNSLPANDFLSGKKFTLKMDNGFAVEYDVADFESLKWRYPGEEWHEETYRCFECGENLYFFAHVQAGLEFGQALKCAVDFSNGLATILRARQGNGHAWREVGYEFLFGVLDMDGITPPDRLRQGFTTELVGKAFTWNYSGPPNGITSMHTYSSPWGYTWTIFLDNQEGGMMWSSPCTYVKLREDAYIMAWVEETSAGGLGTVLINLRTMHDAGFMYGAFGEDVQVGLSSLGAYARQAGSLDIGKYFEPKVK